MRPVYAISGGVSKFAKARPDKTFQAVVKEAYDYAIQDIGLDFAGTGTILAFEKQKKKSLKKHLWQKIFQGFAKSKSKNYKWSRH